MLEVNVKRVVSIVYLTLGLLYCILNLPNLMARVKGHPLFAFGLGILRIVFWPIFLTTFIKENSSLKLIKVRRLMMSKELPIKLDASKNMRDIVITISCTILLIVSMMFVKSLFKDSK